MSARPRRSPATSARGRGVLLDTMTMAIRPTPQAPPLAPPRPAIVRHLVLAYRPKWQALSDLHAIAHHVAAIDPTIATFVAPADRRNAVVTRDAATRPTLIVSNGIMPVFRPRRGRLYQGSVLPKIDELRRLSDAGVPVPMTTVLTPDLVLDPAEWGEFVIVKPTDRDTSSHGLGITLMRTRRVRYRAPAEYPADHPGRHGPMLVQQFVDTGDHVVICRVLTLFGEPLYAIADRTLEPRVSLHADDAEIEAAPIASQLARGRQSVFVDDPHVLALARAAHAAVPEVPLKGCDIVQDARTGRLYVLELNCGGNTWHFSSAQQAHERARNGAEFEMRRAAQFDAFRTAARVLVERTNAEAV